ncbi:hypothetical protein ACWGPO_18225 [Achromobacter animicus]|uniref:hypothetical protein n=1 Tax=Achromobacter sp. UBA4530 TaxID=1945912 RepID=UPI00257C04B0|nr:hypothetical protein [Achromobacter sp. UBA4530]
MTDRETPQAIDAFAVFTRTGSAPDCFELHENGVVSQEGGARTYTAFADIQDLCLYTGQPDSPAGSADRLAYRSAAQGAWTVATGIDEFPAFMDAFRSHYVARRLPVLESLTEQGARVTFRYITGGTFPNLETRDVSLSAQGLHIDGVTWPYESLQPIDLNDWTDTVTLQDDSGKTVFSCRVARILSSDLFVNLVYNQLGQTAEYA